MGRRHTNPFKASAKTKRQYKALSGALLSPLTAAAKAAKKNAKRKRRG